MRGLIWSKPAGFGNVPAKRSLGFIKDVTSEAAITIGVST